MQFEFEGGATYTSGATKRVTVVIADPQARRWGFQASARQGENRAQAGSIRSVDGNTRVQTGQGIQYITHTSQGTRLGTTGSIRFEFDWTAPESAAGDVTFYVAANAANGNGSNDAGDRIYTRNSTLTPAAGGGGQRPTISESGVQNAASDGPTIAPNTFVAIKGTNLAPTTRLWESRDFDANKLPTQLDGVSVTIGGKATYVYYISPTQINVLTPTDLGEGSLEVQVRREGEQSAAVTAMSQRVSPAFFRFDPEDRKYIAATHVDGGLLGKTTLYPGSTTPAKRGETIVLYANGFGPVTPAAPNGEVVTTPGTIEGVTASIGNVPATVSFAGLTLTGLYQLNVVVPESAPTGDAEVIATVGGVSTPGGAFITIE